MSAAGAAAGHTFPPPLERSYAVVEGRIRTRALEAHVVDQCNLACAACCSLSPFLPRRLEEPAALARDLARAARALAPRVFKLVGGEPLLHPALLELVAVVRASRIAPTISITTNGLLLSRAPDALFQAIDALTISLYPRPVLPDAAIAAIEARAARFDVVLNWKRQSHFVQMDRAAPCADEREVQAIYEGCWLRERCHLVRDGRFYACTRPVHLATLHRGALDLERDGVTLDEGDDLAARLLAYLGRPEPLAACAHCRGGAAPLEPHRLLERSELLRGRP